MFSNASRPFLPWQIAILVSLAFTESMAQSDNAKAFSSTSKELIGLWTGQGEVIEFRSDGKCRYDGEMYPYELSQGHLVIQTDFGRVVFAYAIESGQLLLTAGGVQSVYTRMTFGYAETPPQKNDRNPPDLVGQWCYIRNSTGSYTNRCITLKADGTYLYQQESSRSVQTEDLAGGTASSDSDSGTWYVSGDRLYYISSALRGSGSYRLERRNHPVNKNDPMIVLDDEPFVTTTSRPPWR
jgi:hypothetical protein